MAGVYCGKVSSADGYDYRAAFRSHRKDRDAVDANVVVGMCVDVDFVVEHYEGMYSIYLSIWWRVTMWCGRNRRGRRIQYCIV